MSESLMLTTWTIGENSFLPITE